MQGPTGEVITFYSFTGGTGRSAALANAACLLAQRCTDGQSVLMVDWSLEAPGLHHLFRPYCKNEFGLEGPQQLDQAPGLLELFTEASAAATEQADGDALMEQVQPARFAIRTDIPNLHLLKAGRFDGAYYQHVAGFDWRGLDERTPWLIGGLVDHWRKHYRYILIDSRCGVNEMSGMCSMMLPDKLVALFTLNRQSIEGAADIIRFASEYRKGMDGAPALEILPVPSRVDTVDAGRAEALRFGKSGYQGLFEELFREVHGLPGCRLQSYFSEVLLPYNPRYSFGEQLAAVVEQGATKSPLARAYENLAARLATFSRPWDELGEVGDASRVEIDGRLMSVAEAEAELLKLIPLYMGKRDNARLAATLQKLAGLEAREGRTLEARAYYQQALALLKATGNQDQFASLVEDIGKFELKAGNAEEAIRSLSDAVAAYRDAGASRKLARALNALAAAEAEALRVESARQRYLEIVEIARADRDHIGVAAAYLTLGELDRNTDPAQALTYLEQASEIFANERDNRNLASCLRSLAHVHLRAGRLEDAERNYERCLEISRGDADPRQQAYTLLGLANVDRKLRKYEIAEQRYREALELFTSTGEKSGLAMTLQRLAELELRAGRVDGARQNYQKAYETLRETNEPRAMANVAMGLGDLARRCGDAAEAYKRYEGAMELYRGLYNSLGQANALLNLGDLERRRGEVEPARERYHQAIQLFKQANGRTGMANTLKSLGDLESEAEQYRLAREHYLGAADLYRSDRNQLGLANALQALGDLERGRRNLTDAKKYYDQARELYAAEHSPTGLAYTYSELARVSHLLCDFASSIAYLEQALSSASQVSVVSVRNYVWSVGAEIRGSRN